MRIDFPNIEGTIEIYMDVLKAICGPTEGKSMIDLMCAFAPNTPKLGFANRTYIDVLPRKLDHKEEQNNFMVMNVLSIHPSIVLHDVAICSDGIEHLKKEDGYKLLEIMQRMSHKQILFTPLDDILGMYNEGDTSPEEHRSLWRPEDVLGYAKIVFPDYHKTWNGGAWFFWKMGYSSGDMFEDFERVVNILKQTSWAKL